MTIEVSSLSQHEIFYKHRNRIANNHIEKYQLFMNDFLSANKLNSETFMLIVRYCTANMFMSQKKLQI